MHVSERTVHPDRRPIVASESDALLVQRARRDRQAFAPLYERYHGAVLRYTLRSLRDWQEAEDATQQVFANALAGIPRFRGTDDSFRRWLFRIARNEVIDRHRQRARRSEIALAEPELLMDADRTIDELADAIDAHVLVEALFEQLPHEQWRCCHLRSTGLSHREIALVLGKSESAVRVSYCRGMATLRAHVRESRDAR